MKDLERIGILPIQDILNRRINPGGLVRVKRLLLQEDAGRSRLLQISSARVLRHPMPILDRRERAVHRAVKKQAGREGPAW